MDKLKEVIISITNRCNLRCKACDIPLKGSKELPTATWKQVIEDVYRLGGNTIVFSGGEPLLREDLFELISYATDRNIGVCITSNGTLIDDRVAKEIKEGGVNVVNISVEGDRVIHDYLCGGQTFNKALSALGNLQKYGIETTIAAMVSNYNYNHLPYIVKLAQKYGVTTVKLQPFSEIFIAPGKEKDSFFVRAEDSDYLLYNIREFISLSNKYGISINPIKYLEKMYSYLVNKNLEKQFGCAALKYSCPIDAQGEVYPCWKLTGENYFIGNVDKDSFLNIYRSQKHKDIMEEILRAGCPGCVMSCYDEVFDKGKAKEKSGIFKDRTTSQHLSFVLKRLFKKVRFYTVYRLSFKIIIRKFIGLISRQKKDLDVKIDIKEDQAGLLINEINESKRLIERELHS